MISRDETRKLLQAGLEASAADQTEVVLIGEDLSLTRFAESQIHQNLYRSDTMIHVRAIKEKRIGIASTGKLTTDAVAEATKEALAIAELVPADEDFVSLPQQTDFREVATFYKNTAEFTPTERAGVVKKLVDASAEHNLKTAGAYRNYVETVGVMNSLGVDNFNRSTRAELSATVVGPADNSGWGIAYSRSVDDIDVNELASVAIDKALRSVNPVTLESGQYTVILEPAAVGQLLLFLAFMGFGGKTFHQRRSFMAGKIGEQITGENITIIEDPMNPQIAGIPFDYEGVPRQRVPLIENGVAKGVVYNSYYGNLQGVASTGHALPPDNSYGPYPKHMTITGGEHTLQEMVASTERGIYITHFWYVNFLNPMRTMVTGTTRDGTFLIEDGEITSAVENMRMSQSILEAFSNVEMLSRERKLYPQYSVVMLVPAMKINNYNLEAAEG